MANPNNRCVVINQIKSESMTIIDTGILTFTLIPEQNNIQDHERWKKVFQFESLISNICSYLFLLNINYISTKQNRKLGHALIIHK